MNRILDFSNEAVSLRIARRQLEITRRDGSLLTTPVEEIAVVILTHPSITLTKTVLQELALAGAVLVVCDEKHLPTSMLAPLIGHHLASRIMREQASTSPTIARRAWKEIVRAKISGQAQILKELQGHPGILPRLAREVKTGDSSNLEAQAAHFYWQRLFGAQEFTRNPDSDDMLNIALNYGYAILRAITARAITAAGLNPALGIFHHNKYDSFCLADDLMEPLRPVVDRIVWQLLQDDALSTELTSSLKRQIITAVNQRYILNGRQETIFEVSCRLAVSLADLFGGREDHLCLPEKLPCPTEEMIET